MNLFHSLYHLFFSRVTIAHLVDDAIRENEKALLAARENYEMAKARLEALRQINFNLYYEQTKWQQKSVPSTSPSVQSNSNVSGSGINLKGQVTGAGSSSRESTSSFNAQAMTQAEQKSVLSSTK